MKYRKIVIKIGTSVLAKKDRSIDKGIIENIASQVSCLLDRGVKVILVTSGAIGCGCVILKLKTVPKSLSGLQAIASIGQNELMRFYSEAFKKRNYLTGQILLTQEDFDHRRRYLNIKYTIDALISKNAVPIVNENDTVSTEEIKCGDNDRLSSLVADLSEADSLIMLTDVDGLYDKDGKVITLVEKISEDIKKLSLANVRGSTSLTSERDERGRTSNAKITKGGMATKIEAAERSINSGIDCFIANGRKADIILNILEGKGVYTYFKAKPIKAKAKKRWIAYSSKVKGRIIVDDGALRALKEAKKSLLASGIIGKEGNFKAGDVVGISDSKRRDFARGLTSYSSKEIERIKGLKTNEIESVLGYKDHDEVVHRDNLVIL
ncbi:MAG: glutamate 5-kinase [Candidatus Omnitrophota bacterium]|nr:MAG: glutamate 5-kinase [Candidatus Omnitrophota bacterium]